MDGDGPRGTGAGSRRRQEGQEVIFAATDLNVAQNVAFGIIAALMILSAINVVRSRNVVHAALSLVALMGGAAAQYLLLDAKLVAFAKVLVCIRADMILFLFRVM